MANDKHLQVFLDRIRDGLLRVDPDGTAWSIGRRNRHSNKVYPHEPRLHRATDHDGYLHLSAHAPRGEKDGRHCVVNIYTHRLVYLIYVGQIPEGYTINHKNGIKTDNRVENLEVMTSADNTRHAVHELKLRRHRSRVLDDEKARAIFIALRAGEKAANVASRFGISIKLARNVKKRYRWARATADL